MGEADFESFAERFCDGYCKFPYICETQEEMETICDSCPLKELEELIEKSSGDVKNDI